MELMSGRCDGTPRHDGEEVPVDADVKAGLLKLFFDVDLALADERLQVGAEPGDLLVVPTSSRAVHVAARKAVVAAHGKPSRRSRFASSRR